VCGQIAPPAGAGEAGGARSRIRRDDAQHAARLEQRRGVVDRRGRVVQVLDHVGEHDRVVARRLGVRDELAERAGVDRQPEPGARVARRVLRQLEPFDLVAAPAALVEQQPVPAAHVQQPASRRVLADLVEQAPRGGPATLLLVEVVLVAHVPVEREQGVAAR